MKDIKYQYAYDESNTLVSIKDYTKESSKLHTFKLHCKRWQVRSQERFCKVHRTEERGIQRGYFTTQKRLLCTKHSDTIKCKR